MSHKNVEYTSVSEVAGPLMIVEKIKDVAFNEVVKSELLLERKSQHFCES